MKTRQIRQIEENLEKKLRNEYQGLYKQKCQNYFNMLETKYQTLKDSIESVYKQIQNDQVLSTMLNDRTTSAHINERIKQIFSQIITHERQIIFKKLGTQITNLKFENQQLQRQNEKLKNSNYSLQKNFTTQRESLQKKKDSTSQQLKKVKEQLAQYRNKFEQMAGQNKELKFLIQNIKQRHEATQRQNQQINQYRFRIRQMESTIDQLKNRLKENQQKFERKYQSKKKDFQQKISSYKSVITQMNNERLETQQVVRRAQQENANIYMEKKMLALMKDHEKKVSQIKSAKQRQKSDMERMYESKMKQMQSYFEKLLEHKIHEIEENTGVYFQKMKQEGTNLQRHLEHYQEHYVPVSDYEQQIGKRDQIMILMKNKLEQFEVMSEEFIKKQEIMNNKLKDSQIIIGSFKQKNHQLQELNQQLIGKVKSYEQANNIFKISQQKSKDQFLDYERLIKKTKEECQDLKQSFIKLQHEKNYNEGQIRQKERKMKDLLEQNQILLKKIKKLNQSNEEQIKQKQGYSVAIGELKKQITNLEYKLKDKEMTSNLNATSWQNKINALQLDIKEKNKLLVDLQEKYQQISTIYQEQKRKNYQLQNGIKKYQMESKFYKEAGEMHKNQNHSAIQQYRKVANDKNQKISSLQSELQKKNTKLNELESQLRNQKESAGNQKKKMLAKIKKMGKLVVYQLENLRKQNCSIAQYLKSRSTILQNEQSIFKSTFTKDLIHLQMSQEHERDKIIRMTKNEMTQVYNSQIKTIKGEFQEKIKQVYERAQVQKNQMKKQIKEKQIKLQEINKDQKRLQAEIKKYSQEVMRLQKENETNLTKSQKQKQNFQLKFRQMLRQMKDEKDQIVKQYEDKKYMMQQQIQNLANNLKRLKLQAQNIQIKHEEEKASINSQLRTIKQQEEVIQRVAHQKDLQIQRIIKDYQASLQSKKLLQHQNRGYSETLNKKMQNFHQIEIRNQQIMGDLNLIKSKYQLMNEENTQLKRKLSQKQDQLQENMKLKLRYQNELKDIKGALSRSHKNHELRSLNELSIETLQLSNKVNQMRKVGSLLESKTPLRS